ncbi:hypothetical protein COOONC_11772 [Cooperia oncophora]
MSEAMRRLREPSTSYDVLRDFGASYATYPKRVSAVYFERLANALNQTATQLQEGDHQGVEKAPSRKQSINSSEKDKSLKSLADADKSPAEEEQLPVSASFSSFSTPKHRIHSRGSLSCMDSMREHSDCLGHLYSLIWDSKAEHHGPNDVCPITAEAWTVLSAFLVNQVSIISAVIPTFIPR